MKIGIIGSGTVGQTLANGFLKHGYEVMIGSRDKNKIDGLNKNNLKIGDFSETAQFGDLIVLAVKGNAALSALKLAGEKNLENKTVIDATNPIADTAPENGVLKFFTSLDNSLMEQLQGKFPKTKFVKAFNSIGAACMVNPVFKEKPTMFICGNDENAKKEVSKIVSRFGFEAEDMGKAEAARAIEPLCILWCIPGFLNNEWHHGFRMLRK